jgi:hypothetical protein
MNAIDRKLGKFWMHGNYFAFAVDLALGMYIAMFFNLAIALLLNYLLLTNTYPTE